MNERTVIFAVGIVVVAREDIGRILDSGCEIQITSHLERRAPRGILAVEEGLVECEKEGCYAAETLLDGYV